MDSVVRGITIYFILLAALRLSGRRTVAQMTTFDFVLLLIIAETTQQALLGDDFSIVNATLLILTLFGVDIVLSYLKQWSPKIALFLDGTATVLIADGKVDERALKRARVNIEDILVAAREQQGLARLDQIKFAVLEADGGISIIPR
ncbi:DUF421 domain-containing protein (plasmid) [Sinorhizobium meliloti WSM1022]|jgi:uncharacterized membrane protein YcaP (DUF421 family)|uniref:DUF421 domain-containing protein n=1 Tax=Rhizobium meliloti TaxID=382 RepID=A0AAW9TZZ5_RHIML|nr:DUF421 domain-containing protein [Sinorhizobium meliloti]AEG08039.1 protein of unknown function DUF421 [Sinorhizobium meliloti BL225C]AGA10760.1 putative membrane protein [Sinorhizobium meliloti GR4]ARS68483.1 DUF421 domain-containing protein [Sinorhizobium meliloti RU11/001]ASJ63243.1 DUF421 domain-containing protein [Sinorhizobium meliloti]ASP55201.1 DUF421 domain-containing protein [Sinorhizobium meliloti]